MVTEDSDDELSETHLTIKKEIAEIQTCPKCGNTRLMRDYECAEIVCMNCGVVIHQKIVYKESECKDSDREQKLKYTSVGAPLMYTIHDRGLTTVIDWHNRDNYDENLSVSQKPQVYRLHKWQRRIRVTGSTENNWTFALSEITKISNKLKLPKNILETATVVYRKAVEEQLINSHTIRSISTATLYLACRQYGLPISLDEIAQASAVNKKEIGKSYRCLIKKFDYSIPPLQPNQYITKFSSQLTMQEKVEEIAHKILLAAKDSKLTSGREPTSIAAAANYVAVILIGEHKTQKEIADIAQITERTIKKRYRELVNRLMFKISI